MVKKYYDDNGIPNGGESEFSQWLDGLRNDTDECWHAVHNYVFKDDDNRREREADFILVCRTGVIVVEVKGWHPEVREGVWYERTHGYGALADKPERNTLSVRTRDPFIQVWENWGAIKKKLERKKLPLMPFVISLVVFPLTVFDYDHPEREKWGRYLDAEAKSGLPEVLKEVFKKQAAFRNWDLNRSRMTPAQVESVMKALSPDATFDEIRAHIIKARKMAVHRHELSKRIVEGLYGNRKLLIQGPPGSGKSSAAVEYVRRQSRSGKRGIYICWNLLLAASMKAKFANEGWDIEVWPWFELVKNAMVRAGHLDLVTFEKSNELEKLIEQVGGDFQKQINQYDYVVVDEAQDLFHRGIIYFLEAAMADGNGLEKGEFMVLYDHLQAYSSASNGHDNLNYLMLNAAHYKLSNHFRSSGAQGIIDLITAIDMGIWSPDAQYGPSVDVKTYNSKEQIVNDIRKTYNVQYAKKNYRPEECVVLFSSNLYDYKDERDRPFNGLMPADLFEQANEDNIASPQKVHYSTALRFKGLERDVVFLVVADLDNPDRNYKHEFFIGVTRAKSKIYIKILST